MLQFSTIIGTYLFAMGVGSWLTRWVVRSLTSRFVQLQITVGLLGGLSSALLFVTFGYTTAAAFRVVLYLVVFLIGMLVGLEIPLLLRILKDRLEFRELVSQVLALDYIGALVASVLFPLVLVPHLGLVRTACLFGLINVGVALVFLYGMGRKTSLALQVQAWLAVLVLVGAFVGADWLTRLSEEALYPEDIILARTSPYQRLIVTGRHGDIRLYLNNNLQFSSEDEYRYHEALVAPAMGAAKSVRRVLILGGGDGLAARQVLRDPRVESVTLVDLDPEMTRLFSTHPLLVKLNAGALTSGKLQVVNDDAYHWLERQGDQYDVIVVDFPDPSNYSVSKLYTTTFYRTLQKHLAPEGAASVQCTSPLFARRSFWCIVETIRAVGLQARPYHAYVPSFGEWGFALVTHRQVDPPRLGGEGHRFLTPGVAAAMFEFPADMAPVPVEVNRLYNGILVRYYDQDWRKVTE